MGDTSGGNEHENIDFSIDGAQSINLQNHLQSNTSEFICETCKRHFGTLKGLNIHHSHHNKLTAQINAKKFTRKRKQCQEVSNFIDESGQCHISIADLDEFLKLQDQNECTDQNNENLMKSENNNHSATVCPECSFVSKTRADSAIHMKTHTNLEFSTNVDTVSNVESQTQSKIRVECPFSPSKTFVDKKRLQNHL